MALVMGGRGQQARQVAKEYWNQRHSDTPWEAARLSFEQLRDCCWSAYHQVLREELLDHAFGWHNGNDWVLGTRPQGLSIALFLDTKIKIGDQSLEDAIRRMDEGDLFTVIEFINDHVAEMHFAGGLSVDAPAAQETWRRALNPFLRHYGPGYELTAEGVIAHLPEAGFEEIYAKAPPVTEDAGNVERVHRAHRLFRSTRSGRAEKQEAVRNLADVLEWYQKSTPRNYGNGEGVKSREETLARIGEFVQRFRIRHNGPDQIKEYPDALIDLFFHQALAFIHFFWATRHPQPEPTPTKPDEVRNESPYDDIDYGGIPDDDKIPF